MVIGQVRVQHSLQHVVNRRLGCVEGQVEVALHLRPGTGKIEGDMFACNIDPHRDWDIDGAHAVVVQQVGKFVAAVGNTGDAVTQAGLRSVHDGSEGSRQQGRGVAEGQFPYAARTQAAGRYLGEIVAPAFVGHPHVQQQQIKYILHQFTGREQADQGDTQTLLIDFRHATGHTAWRHAADICMVRDIADEAQDFAVNKTGHSQIDIRQMGAAGDIGVVGDKNIAVRHALHPILGQ